MKIYTKTGDDGETGLYKGERVSKDSTLICALGDIDELNSALGVCRAQLSSQGSAPAKPSLRARTVCSHREPAFLEKILITVQKDLMAASAELAGADSVKQLDAGKLEDWIDELSEGQPEQRDFVIPGDNKEGDSFNELAALQTRAPQDPSLRLLRTRTLCSFFHMARSVCRRAERSVVALTKDAKVNPETLKYLNRLSDLLFVMGL